VQQIINQTLSNEARSTGNEVIHKRFKFAYSFPFDWRRFYDAL
jgi:hypothetical protein